MADPTPERIAEVLRARLARGTSACPSEIARALRPRGWRPLMDPVREVAARLAERGELEVTQRGEPVDPARARGPVRYRRAKPGGGPPG
ncbi:DUF3253 domain-containing protein [Actinokineospora bangkokensis]|uniref:S-adenosylmethionine tRNA ribosyltransferase n=1 Tax=Actinokineospora bangkokensis TaxID=1193682 RepID=A0A1Q9LIC3_9PSEU|nr:DUF3253 domain-containing protein [Actinokineospora bangkokensis]OLR91776.1 S-adenosylmethionine tRNA ribosyltransferase [Actinokineospora bangkokensis]